MTITEIASRQLSRTILIGYQAQGFRLPEGWDADRVYAEQQRLDIKPLYVPEAVVATGNGKGVVAWGVPFIDGKPLKHPAWHA